MDAITESMFSLYQDGLDRLTQLAIQLKAKIVVLEQENQEIRDGIRNLREFVGKILYCEGCGKLIELEEDFMPPCSLRSAVCSKCRRMLNMPKALRLL